MYRVHIVLGVALAGLALAACDNAPPPRDPGLWAERVQAGSFDESILICMGHEEHAKVDLWGTQFTRFVCGSHSLKPRGDGAWTFASICDNDSRGTVRTSGVASGDFRRHWRMDATSIVTGARDPADNGARPIHITAVWENPHCPRGVNPADLHIPDVKRPPG
jgi:hypothetical protein